MCVCVCSLSAAAEAAGRGLSTHIVRDAGRTQIAAGSKTVLCIGPGQLYIASQISIVIIIRMNNILQELESKWIQSLDI